MSSQSQKKEIKPVKIKDSDIRYTQNSTFKLIDELTGIDFKKAYDPTPKDPKVNSLNLDWKHKDIFLNPPFSKAKVFVKKLLDDMDKFKEIKNALIILPWYFVEDYKDRVSSAAKWYKSLRNRMSEYNFKRFHLKNQPFKRPDGKEVLVRVYAIYLSR